MPFIKRGGGEFKLAPVPRRKSSSKKSKSPKTKIKEGGKQVTPKPKPKLTHVVKRKATASKYVYLDGGILIIKTPSITTRWNQGFRSRVIRDYVAPRTLKSIPEYNARFYEDNDRRTVYDVQGNKLIVDYPHDPLKDHNQTIVLRTDVINLTKGTRLFLNHDEPAMRILMIYCFLTDERIVGVPKLAIDAFTL